MSPRFAYTMLFEPPQGWRLSGVVLGALVVAVALGPRHALLPESAAESSLRIMTVEARERRSDEAVRADGLQARLRVMEEENARLRLAMRASVLQAEALTERLEDLAELDGWSPLELAVGDGDSSAGCDASEPSSWLDEALAAQAATGAWTQSLEDRLCHRAGELAALPSAWPVLGRVSSGFGPRRDPFTGHLRLHRGLDIVAARGSAVLAAGDGIVEMARREGGYGNCVVIDHGNGLKSVYAHLQRLHVAPGQAVARGHAIGRVGSTGRAKGAHLHLEILSQGERIDPLEHLGQGPTDSSSSLGT